MRFVIPVFLLMLSGCVSTPDPDEERNRKASAVNVQLGIGYLQQNNLESANEKLYKALLQDPESAPAHNAYAILQERLMQFDKAEIHYSEATRLDPNDSQSANNFGAFLCRRGREAESVVYFDQAVKNPLYRTPEFAYTNAARCLIKIDRDDEARDYLTKALAVRSDFGVALYTMADLNNRQGRYAEAKTFIEQYHLVSKPTAATLWFAIGNELELGNKKSIEELAEQLRQEFPDSEEYQQWLRIQ